MPGSFWDKVGLQHRRAVASGALMPVATDCVVAGEFELRVATALARKPGPGHVARSDPFLPPYELELFVGNVGPSHACLLNKYPVFDRHALLVTRDYEPQDSFLTEADCGALLVAIALDGILGFYNAGRLAGASQPHKHLQAVPLRAPLSARIAAGDLPFRHVVQPTPPGAREFHAAYLRAMESLGLRPGAPWNLLATREWMLVVPRAAEDFHGVSLNALAFAGSLFAKTAAWRDHLLAAGPWTALQAVTFPRVSAAETAPNPLAVAPPCDAP